MTALKAKDTIDQQANTACEVESGIAYLVRENVGERQPTPDAVSDLDGLKSLITRVSGDSANQIDRLITELHEVRNYLRSEGKRVQRELSQYALMNQRAIESNKIISDSLETWRGTTQIRRVVEYIGS